MDYSFNGITGQVNTCYLKTEWIGFDSEEFMSTKKTYEHKEEGLSFKYLYAVSVTNVGDSNGEDLNLVTLELVVDKSSLAPKVIESILSSMSLDSIDEINNWEIIAEGGSSIIMGEELVGEEDLEKTIIGAMATVRSIDGMRGFFIDKPLNSFGMTGWDIIEYSIGNKEELFEIK